MIGVGDGDGDAAGLIVMCGAVEVSRLDAPLAVITIGTSPVLTVAGKMKVNRSVPGKSEAALVLPLITVVPTVALIAAGALLRTPVSETRNTVGTRFPVPSSEVILNGSGVHTVGLVALHTAARPPGPFVLVKISGCDATMVTAPRNTVPLLLMAIGKIPAGSARGTTNLIWVELTENSPQAAPLMATETPFNSIGNDGARVDSEALVLLTVALVTAPKLA